MIRTEADSNDITDGMPRTGMFGVANTSLSAF